MHLAIPRPSGESYTSTAIFRFGLKNGNGTTVAVVFIRWASIVDSICSLVPVCVPLCLPW